MITWIIKHLDPKTIVFLWKCSKSHVQKKISTENFSLSSNPPPPISHCPPTEGVYMKTLQDGQNGIRVYKNKCIKTKQRWFVKRFQTLSIVIIRNAPRLMQMRGSVLLIVHFNCLAIFNPVSSLSNRPFIVSCGHNA